MLPPFSWVRWLRSVFRPPVKTIRKSRRLALEHLETRLAPATHTWTGADGNGLWSDSGNWTGGAPTGIAANLDDLVFPTGPSGLGTSNDLGLVNGSPPVINSITFAGNGYSISGNQFALGGFLISNGSGETISADMQLGGPLGTSQTFTIGSSADLTINGHLSGSTGSILAKDGPGTLFLTNDNSAFSGPISLDTNSGILNISHSRALGSGVTIVGSGSQLELDGTTPNGPLTITEAITLNGSGPGGNGALLNEGGNNVVAGTLTLDSDVILGDAAGLLNISGQITDLGAGHQITKEGVGQMYFSHAGGNTYRGQTIINNGILTITDPNALGNSASFENSAVVNQSINEVGTLQILDPNTATDGGGFTVANELLTLNGAGVGGLGALDNVVGNNTWSDNVTLGSAFNGKNVVISVDSVSLNPTSLTISGVVGDPTGAGPFTLTKIGTGELIFTNSNTYLGTTTVNTGILDVRDSQGLGPSNKGALTTVLNGAALEIQLRGDNNPDSVTASLNSLLFTAPLSLFGTGISNTGALRSVSGINYWDGPIQLNGATVAIGVDPAVNPTSDETYFFNDWSLTVTNAGGGIAGGTATTLAKVGTGQLILPNANPYQGPTSVQQGWITVQDPLSLGTPKAGLGEGAFPYTTIQAGAAVHLLPLDPTMGLTLNNNFNIVGLGITHPFATLNHEGALLSLGGLNTLTGIIQLNGIAGIGVQLVDPATQSQLILNGSIWDATPTPSGGDSLTKLGPYRLVVQADGTYTGPVDIKEGVLLAQNDTALGAGVSTTTVETGTALELANSYAPNNGGLSVGLEVWGEHLILNGTGNPSFGDGPLAILVPRLPNDPQNVTLTTSDNVWHGAITLDNSVTFNIPANVRLTFAGQVDDGPPTASPANLTETGGGELVLSGSNTFRGSVFVDAGTILTVENAMALGGTGFSEVQTLTLGNPTPNLTTFTLSFANSVSSSTTGGITYKGDGTDAATIQAALNALPSMIAAGGSVTVTQSGNVFTVVFGGNLTGFQQQLLSASVISSDAGTATVTPARVLAGAGGTVVADGATIQLSGGITVSGEPLLLQGQGVTTTPATPLRWFSAGPAPVLKGQTAGSGNVSGRVTGVAVDPTDPNTIYISTAGGGAWKTKNGGLTWQPLFDSQVDGSVLFSGAIAIAPSDPQTIYLGTGEADNSGDSYYGTGVYVSHDSGRTWTLLTTGNTPSNPLYNPLNGQAISRIVVDPNNPNLVYVASSDLAVGTPATVAAPGIWRYDGTTWFDLTGQVSTNRASVAGQIAAPNTPGPDDDYRISFPQQQATWSDLSLVYTDISNTGVGPLKPVLYAALGTSSGDINNAVFWSENPTSNRPLWYVGDPGGLFANPATSPAGVDARSAGEFPAGPFGGGLPRNGNIKITAIAGSLLVNTIVYAAVTNPITDVLLEVRRTTTGGQNWNAANSVITPPINYLGTQGDYDSTIVAGGNFVYVGGQEASPNTHVDHVLQLNIATGVWTDISVQAGNGPHTDDHGMALDSSGRLIVGNDGGVWRFDPTTNRWTDINGNLATIQFNGVASNPTNPNIVLGASQDNGAEISNGGLAWTWVNSGDGGEVAINQTNPNDMYVVNNGFLVESTTGGTVNSFNTVLSVPGGPQYFPFVLDNNSPGGQRLLVGGTAAPALQQSLDGGANWQSLNSPLATVTALAISDYQGSFDNTGFPSVTDLGANTYDPGTIYISDGSQVELTKNDGNNWVSRTSNLPSSSPFSAFSIQDLEVDPRNRDTVYVVDSSAPGTNAGRVWVSTNAGISWSSLSAGLPDIPTWKLVIDPRTGNLFVGNDDGVWELVSGTTTWTRFGEGMPHVQVQDLYLNQNLNLLLAGTYGRSMYQFSLDDVPINAGALRNVSGSSVWTGPVLLVGGSGVYGNNAVTISATGTQALKNGISTASLTLLGPISDLTVGTNPRVVKLGQGNVVFAGSNTYGGVTEVVQGVLIAANPNALGGTTNGTIVDTGAALGLESNLTSEPIQLNGDGISFNGHNTGALHNISNANTYTGTITLNSNSTIGVESGSSLTIKNPGVPNPPGTITDGSNNFSLTKELTGTLVLVSANSYHGSTFVNQGVLNIQNANSLGIGTATTQVLDGAQLQVQGGLTISPNETLRISGAGIAGTGALVSINGLNKWEGTVLLAQDPGRNPTTNPASAVTFNVVAPTNPGDGLTLDGQIRQASGTPSPNLGLTKIGAGLLILNNNTNRYTGITTVAAGILRIQQGNALGTAGGPPDGSTVVNSGAVLQLDGGNAGFTVPAGETLTLNNTGINAAGTLENLTGNNTWAGNIVLQTSSSIGADGTTSLTVSGVIQNPSPTPPSPPSLVKVGTGTVKLTNDNTFTGTTVVIAGILLADGPVAGNTLGTVIVTGGLLGGTGNVGTLSTTAGGGGAVYPGDSTTTPQGTLSALDTTLNSGSTYLVSLTHTGATPTSNLLAITGNLTLNGAALSGIVDPSVAVNDTFTIITFTGSLLGTGKFAEPNGPNVVIINGQQFAVIYNTNSIQLRALPLATSTSVSAAPASGDVYGEPVTLTATITDLTGPAPPSSGTVTFYADSTSSPALGSNTVTAGASTGTASITTSALTVGTHTLIAVYSGGGPFGGSQGQLNNYVVSMANTAVTVSAVPSSGDIYGQSVTFTATISGTGGSTAVPNGGTVTFYADSTSSTALGTNTVSGGTTSINTSAVSAGTHTIIAIYSGDGANFNGSQGQLANYVVSQASTSVSVGASPTSSVYGQSVTLTATVTVTGPTPAVLDGGTVTFYVDSTASTPLGSNSVSTGSNTGTASISTTAIPSGTHTILAVYSGDTNFSGNTGTLPNYQVSTANTTVGLTASPASGDVYGEPVTLTATVTANNPSTAIVNGGTVNFYVDSLAEPLGSATVINGTAQITTTNANTLMVGTHTLIAVYGGNSNYNGNTGTLPNYVVSKADTATTLSGNPNPSGFTQSVVITATVTGSNGSTIAPNGGTVTFTFGLQTLGSQTVSNGQASITVAAGTLPLGTDQINATYSGDGVNFNGDTATPYNQVVVANTTSTTIAPSNSTAAYGSTVTYTVTVTGSPATPPNGTVNLSIDGGPTSQSQSLNGSGQATFLVNTTGLSFATHQITANYVGNSNFGASSATASLTVVQASTVTTVTASPSTSTVGQTVTFTATISSTNSPTAPDGGTVTFYDGSTSNAPLGSGNVSGGVATFSTAGLSPGSHTIIAVYSGTTNFGGSTGSLNYVVNPVSTITTISPTSSLSVYGQVLTFTATVQATSSSNKPTGNVVFYVDGTSVATVTLNASTGQASFSIGSLLVGPHFVVAVYTGDSNFGGSYSTTPANVAVLGSTATVAITSTSTSVYGQSVTFTAFVGNINPGVALTQPVSFYVDGAPANQIALTNTNGVYSASFSYAFLPVGAHYVVAVYYGDAYHIGSYSTVATGVIVSPDPTTTTVTSSTRYSFYGQQVTFTATVSPTVAGAGVPSGVVNFFFNGFYAATVAVDGNGQASFTTAALPVGPYAVVAAYYGDTRFGGGVTTTPALETVVANTVTTLTPAGGVLVAGVPEALIATVTQTAPGVAPTGFVYFFVDGLFLAAAQVNSNGQAVVNPVVLPGGSHSITAFYTGDADYFSSFDTINSFIFVVGRQV